MGYNPKEMKPLTILLKSVAYEITRFRFSVPECFFDSHFRYCMDNYSWFLKNAKYVCEKVKRMAYSNSKSIWATVLSSFSFWKITGQILMGTGSQIWSWKEISELVTMGHHTLQALLDLPVAFQAFHKLEDVSATAGTLDFPFHNNGNVSTICSPPCYLLGHSIFHAICPFQHWSQWTIFSRFSSQFCLLLLSIQSMQDMTGHAPLMPQKALQVWLVCQCKLERLSSCIWEASEEASATSSVKFLSK